MGISFPEVPDIHNYYKAFDFREQRPVRNGPRIRLQTVFQRRLLSVVLAKTQHFQNFCFQPKDANYFL